MFCQTNIPETHEQSSFNNFECLMGGHLTYLFMKRGSICTTICLLYKGAYEKKNYHIIIFCLENMNDLDYRH